MKRLTDDNGMCVDCNQIGSCNRNCDIKMMYDKLKKYEDMEEKLAKIYGECDNLLELVIDLLIKHTNTKLHIGEPIKARLLTDDTVDQWQKWKKANEEGRLMEFPCKIGDPVYIPNIPENRVLQDHVAAIYMNEKKETKFEMMDFWRSIPMSECGETFFLAEKEAKEILEKYNGG